MKTTEINVVIEQFQWVLYEDMQTQDEQLSQLHELAWKLVNLTRVEDQNESESSS